ncbi:Fc.00g010110.m01.CDS01 [Cosmosporella sp. VM-42]
MAPYQYQKLDQAGQEFRLIKLLPGPFENKLRVSVTHEPFPVPRNSRVPAEQVPSKDELQTSLPDGWTVWETLEGRFIFNRVLADGTDATTWTHPVADFPKETYESAGLQDNAALRPNYETLSYTWGSADRTDSLFMKNAAASTGGEETTIATTPNLGLALRHLRHADTARVLWVDAICINQQDIDERNEQVRRMGDIYRFASRVVVWLGPKTASSAVAIHTLDHLGNEIEFTRDRYYLPSPHCKEHAWYSSRIKLPYDDETWSAIYDLMGSAWFQRLWVFQEIQLANRRAVMQCGQDSILWYHFRRAILRLGSQMHLYPAKFQALLIPTASISERRLSTTLPRLLGTATTLKCSEPRDKVYAILGLTPPAVSRCIIPQYGLPVGEVYKDVFLAYTHLSYRLELLVRAGLKNKLPHMPSWVPNYLCTEPISLTYAIGYRASGISRADISYIAPNSLDVVGTPISVVGKLGRSKFDSWNDVFQVIRDVGIDRLQSEQYPTGETLFDAYAWTLSSGLLSERIRDVSYYINLKVWKERLAAAAFGGSIPGGDSYDKLPNLILEALEHKQMIETLDGHVGYAPRGIQPGDEICVLLGYNLPVVLRRDGKKNYHLISQCYLHGFMDGEGILGPLPRPWKAVLYSSVNNSDTRYRDCTTGKEVLEDPRLGNLPPGWVRIKRKSELGEGFIHDDFLNTVTGDMMNSDPRLLPEGLKFCGRAPNVFRLV